MEVSVSNKEKKMSIVRVALFDGGSVKIVMGLAGDPPVPVFQFITPERARLEPGTVTLQELTMLHALTKEAIHQAVSMCAIALDSGSENEEETDKK